MKIKKKLRPYFLSMLIMALALVHFSFTRAGVPYDGLQKAQQGEHAADKQHAEVDLVGLSVNLLDQEIMGIENEIILRGRSDNRSWFAPTVAMIPGNDNRPPRVFVTAINLVGHDLGDQHVLISDNLGESWSNALLPQNWQKVPLNVSLRRETFADYNVFESPYFGLHYHSKTDRLIAVGRTHFTWDEYRYYSEPFMRCKDERFFDGLCEGQLEGSMVYSLWDAEKGGFSPWVRLYLPVEVSLQIFPFSQFYEEDDGTLLVPAIDTHRQELPLSRTEERYSPVIARFGFDGTNLHYLDHGDPLSVKVGAKWSNVSLVHFNGKYILTIRQKEGAMVATSYDGLHYGESKPWRFDDGSVLECFDTSQKLLQHGTKLYLVYTRKSDSNGGVYLDRAPLWIAEVDADNLALLKSTEKVVFPQKQAAMGDFCVVSTLGSEAWVITGERIQGMHDNRYIGDLLLGRIRFSGTDSAPLNRSSSGISPEQPSVKDAKAPTTLFASGIYGDQPSGTVYRDRGSVPLSKSNAGISIETGILLHGRRDNRNWFSPEVEIIPAEGNNPPQVFVAVQLVTGHDMGNAYLIKSNDLGKTWTDPMIQQNWFKKPEDNNEYKTPIFGLQYHTQTGKLIAHGRTHLHRDRNDHPDFKRESKVRPSFSEYHRWEFVVSVYNPEKELFEPWSPVEMPEEVDARFTVFHQGQWLEDDDGTLLVPGFWTVEEDQSRRPVVLRFEFDGSRLHYVEHGPYLSEENVVRQGWSNTSLVRYNDKYLLFIRRDRNSSVAESVDGLHFKESKPLLWDNGERVNMNNNSSKWLLLDGKLYITYTRVNEMSGNVLDMRAPLFIAQLDPDNLTMIKASEQIVFPQQHARMDNHTTVSISDKEAWVISGETIRWGRTGFILRKVGDLLLGRILSE